MSIEIAEEYRRAISNEEINVLPLRKWEGPTRVIRNEKQFKDALRHLRGEPLLGFDTETRPVFRKGQPMRPPAILQLCTATEAFVFQLNLCPLTNGIIDLLADPNVIKTGVSVRDDVKALQGLAEFTDAGFVDLGEISEELNMATHGLRNMTAVLLGFRISKSNQCSNWERDPLAPQQISYAATDAWISRELFLALESLGALPPREELLTRAAPKPEKPKKKPRPRRGAKIKSIAIDPSEPCTPELAAQADEALAEPAAAQPDGEAPKPKRKRRRSRKKKTAQPDAAQPAAQAPESAPEANQPKAKPKKKLFLD